MVTPRPFSHNGAGGRKLSAWRRIQFRRMKAQKIPHRAFQLSRLAGQSIGWHLAVARPLWHMIGKRLGSVIRHALPHELSRAGRQGRRGKGQAVAETRRARQVAVPRGRVEIKFCSADGCSGSKFCNAAYRLQPCGSDNRRIVILRAQRDGTYRINVEEVTLGDLAGRLEMIFRVRAERVGFVTADADVPFSRVAELIDVAATQVDKIALLPSLEMLSRSGKRPLCPTLVRVQWQRAYFDNPERNERPSTSRN